MGTTKQFGYIFLGLFCGLALQGQAQEQTNSGYLIHDMARAEAPVVTPGRQGSPPSDAVVLFDGTDLSQWRSESGEPSDWIVADGYMESVKGAGYIFTKQQFGDCQLHIEWATPKETEGMAGQARGNSGVFFMEKYEIQVLDSYKNRTYSDGHAGSIYAQYPPLVNATRPPGDWQSYDIIFRRPRFNKDGTVKRPARMTAMLNGVLVQDNAQLVGPTGWLQQKPYEAHPAKMSIKLQDHGNPVRYRNIWIRPLVFPKHRKKIAMKKQEAKVVLSVAELDRFVGQYESDAEKEIPFLIVRRDGEQLFATLRDKEERPIFPQSKSQFVLDAVDGTFDFVFNAQGDVTEVSFAVGVNSQSKQKL